MSKVSLSFIVVALALLGVQYGLYRSLDSTINTKIETFEKRVASLDALESDLRSIRRELRIASLGAQGSTTPAASEDLQSIISSATYAPLGLEADDPFLGTKDAPLLVMAFLDYQCAPCREFAKKTLPKLKETFFDSNRARFLLRDFPLTSHPQAEFAATAAHCAGEQGAYWQMFEKLYSLESQSIDRKEIHAILPTLSLKSAKRMQRCIRSERYKKEIADDKAEGKKIGAVGAPGFFVGIRLNDDTYQGVFIRGAQPYSVFEDQLLRFEKIALE